MNTYPQGQNGRQSRWAPPEQGNAYQRGTAGGESQAHASSRSKPPMPPPNGNNWWDMHTKSGGNCAPFSGTARFDLSCDPADAPDLFGPFSVNMGDTGKPC